MFLTEIIKWINYIRLKITEYWVYMYLNRNSAWSTVHGCFLDMVQEQCSVLCVRLAQEPTIINHMGKIVISVMLKNRQNNAFDLVNWKTRNWNVFCVYGKFHKKNVVFVSVHSTSCFVFVWPKVRCKKSATMFAEKLPFLSWTLIIQKNYVLDLITTDRNC